MINVKFCVAWKKISPLQHFLIHEWEGSHLVQPLYSQSVEPQMLTIKFDHVL